MVKQQRVFVIADTHFDHTNILKYEPTHRPFETIEEMNSELVRRWNEIVSPDDWVVHVGDFCFGKNKVEHFTDCLKGRKILIKGNHDYGHRHNMNSGFEISLSKLQIDDILFTHKPQPVDKLTNICYNVHGHIHSKKLENELPEWVNVSGEVLNFFPLDITELIPAIQLRRAIGYG